MTFFLMVLPVTSVWKFIWPTGAFSETMRSPCGEFTVTNSRWSMAIPVTHCTWEHILNKSTSCIQSLWSTSTNTAMWTFLHYFLFCIFVFYYICCIVGGAQVRIIELPFLHCSFEHMTIKPSNLGIFPLYAIKFFHFYSTRLLTS